MTQQQLVRNIQTRLPATYEVITGKQSSKETTDSFDAILKILNTFFLVFAGLFTFIPNRAMGHMLASLWT